MKNEPTFEGFRAAHGGRSEWIPEFRRRVAAANKILANPIPYSLLTIRNAEFDRDYGTRQIEQNEGELGLALDRLELILSEAIRDAQIEKNPTAKEFLAIMHSLVFTARADDTVDQLMEQFRPIFNSKQAFSNQVAKISKYDEAKIWMLDQVNLDAQNKGKSKNQLAKDWAPKIKNKFGFLVAESTISRHWLK